MSSWPQVRSRPLVVGLSAEHVPALRRTAVTARSVPAQVRDTSNGVDAELPLWSARLRLTRVLDARISMPSSWLDSARRYSRIPSDRIQPNSSRTSRACQLIRKNGIPAQRPLKWRRCPSIHFTTRAAAASSKYAPGGLAAPYVANSGSTSTNVGRRPRFRAAALTTFGFWRCPGLAGTSNHPPGRQGILIFDLCEARLAAVFKGARKAVSTLHNPLWRDAGRAMSQSGRAH